MALDIAAKILVLGKSQAGKSSFINYYLNTKAAEIGKGKPTTIGYCIEYEYNEGQYPIKIYDNQGFETAIANQQKDEIIKFVAKHNNSSDVLNWFHTIFYCTSAHSRFEDFEADFILDLSRTISQNIHIILTTCDGVSRSALDEKKAFIRQKLRSLGSKCHIFEVVSVHKKKLNGEIIEPYGKEAISESVFQLLWEDICSKISTEYAHEVRSNLISIVNKMEYEMLALMDKIFTIKGIVELSRDDDSFDDYFDELMPEFETVIDRYNEKYRKILQPVYSLYSSYSGIVLNVDVDDVQLNLESMMPDFDIDAEDMFLKHFPAAQKLADGRLNLKNLLGGIWEIATVKKRFKNTIKELCMNILIEIPSESKIQQNAYDELMLFFDDMEIDWSLKKTDIDDTITEEEFWEKVSELSEEEDYCFSRLYAEKGLPFAQYSLGNDYRDGCGVSQDYHQAAYWYGKAAEQGYAPAQDDIGYLYYSGELGDPDYDKAVYWLQKAAEQNYSDGLWSLGHCYFCGNGVIKDKKQAFLLYKQAAESGHDYAMCDLARCYYYGLGVDKSEEHSFYWYRKAAEADNDEAMCRLAEYFSANAEEAHRWYEKAAELGNDEAIQALTHQSSSKSENTFDIILEHIGEQKMTVISDVKSIFNLGLAQAVNLVESAPTVLKSNVSRSEAEYIKTKLEKSGATITLR